MYFSTPPLTYVFSISYTFLQHNYVRSNQTLDLLRGAK